MNFLAHKTSENTKLDTDVFKLEQKWQGSEAMQGNPFGRLGRRFVGFLLDLSPAGKYKEEELERVTVLYRV